MRNGKVAAAFVVCAAFLAVSGWSAEAPKAPHPHFRDGGVLSWSTKLADAQREAKASGKLVFIEYGREAWGNCRVLVENVLPNTEPSRLAKLCVGLAAECDPPGVEDAVQKIFQEHLAGAGALPFVGVVTHDLKWVAGSSGYVEPDELKKLLDEVEKSPVLQATPEVAKKLDALALQAEQGVEKSQWQKVLGAAKSAADLAGRSAARDRIAAAVAKARAWADAEMTKALESLGKGGDRTATKVALKQVAMAFAGQPEAKEADAGQKAADRLGVLETLDPAKLDAAREKATRDFAGTRWAALFAKK